MSKTISIANSRKCLSYFVSSLSCIHFQNECRIITLKEYSLCAYQYFLSFFFCVYIFFLLTHVIFPSPSSYKSFFPVLPAFSFTKPYHTLHSSQKWNDRCYFSSFSNLTSPFGNYSCPVLLLFMWHFRPLLTTSILTEPYTVWSFEASQTQNISGELFDQIPSLFAPLLAAFPFILSIYFIIEKP